MDVRDYVRIYVVNFEVMQAISTPQLIDYVLSFIPQAIRPGYSYPVKSVTVAYWRASFKRVDEALTEIAAINGWMWHTRTKDNRIMFEVDEEESWRKLLMPNN